MPSDNNQSHHKLLGENDSIWSILTLLLVGIITCITTVQLLLSPGMTMETFKAWISPAGYPEQAPKSPIPDTTPIDRLPGSGDAAIPDLPALGLEIETGPDDTQVSRDGSLRTEAPVQDQSIHLQPRTGPGKSRIPDMHRDDRRSSSPPASSEIEGTSEAPAEFAANEALAITDPTGLGSSAERDDARDCAPLFHVRFLYDGIQPLDPDLAEKAHRLRAWLTLHPQVELLVEGHADASGPDEYNLFISHRRAKAVYNRLVDNGIPEQRMAIRALGEYSPLEGLPPESAKNRRVTLRIEGVRACSSLISDGNNR
jgi:outer membrane protein OmpA-like peptidoglycan-associated protein